MMILRFFRPLALAIILTCVLAGGLVGLALAGNEQAVPPSQASEAIPPASAQEEQPSCAVCHASIVNDWREGPHATAFSNQTFQEAWQQQDSDPACLDCHTTNFRPATGEYEAEGVTCQACHSVPEGHPPAPIALEQANQVCGSCHTITHAEFRASLHEVRGLTCTSCHYAHTNGLRLDNELDQCLNCHGTQLNDFAHSSHINTGLTCRQCHGYVRPGTYESRADGQAPTGHDFKENVTACLDCHRDIELVPLNNGQVDGGFSRTENEQSILAGQQAALRAAELEAQVQTLTLANRNQSFMSTVQGGAVGLLIGGVVVWLITRRRKNGANGANGGK